MKKIDIIKSEYSHIDDLHSKIKQSDIDEVYASHGATAKQALEISINNSLEAYTVMVDDVPKMMFGIVQDKHSEQQAIIWMLSTEDIFELVSVKRFIRETKRFVKHFHQQFEVLYNHVDERSFRSLVWLKRVGFKLTKIENDFGFLGLPFIKIESRR